MPRPRTRTDSQLRLPEARVPELPGYVWFGGPDPFEPDAGWYIGNTTETYGRAFEVSPGPKVYSYRLYLPDARNLTKWHVLMTEAGIPPGGLGFGTPQALVWDALARAGYREVEYVRDLPVDARDYDALAAVLQEFAELHRKFPGPRKRFPREFVRDYHVTDR
jgi:hypothetical protein